MKFRNLEIGNWKLETGVKVFVFLSFFISSFLVSTISASAATISRPLHNAGLVGYWPMDEGAGTNVYDRSGNLNHGTLGNMDASTDWVSGKFGGSLDFDGNDDYVDVPESGSLDISSDEVTVSAWVNTRGIGTEDDGAIVWKSHTSNAASNYALRYDYANEEIDCTTVTSVAVVETNSYTLTPNQWHHFVCVYDGTAVYSYVDGSLLGTPDAQSGNLRNGATQGLGIGQKANDGSDPFNGQIDEARVYNRALSVDEIRRLYNLGRSRASGLPNRGLIGYWNFDNDPSGVAKDLVGGKDGVVNGSPTTISGVVGNALDFDGSSDYISVSNFTMPSTGTISYWVKSDTSTWSNHGLPISKRNDFIIHSSSGGQGITLYTAGPVSTDGVSPTSIDSWHHHVWILNGSKSLFYIDGVLASETSTSNLWGTSTSEMRFASDTCCAPRLLAGQMDEIRIYDRPLTEFEVQLLYQQTKADSGRVNTFNKTQRNRLTNGLVGHWTFDGKDSGTTSAFDLSGNGNTGWLINGPKKAIGKIGQSLDFDGSDDYVDIGATRPSELQPSSKVSISTWVYIESFNQYAGIFSHIYDSGTTESGFGLLTDGTDGLYWTLRTGDGAALGPVYEGPTGLSTNTWYHLVATYDSSTGREVYVNGVQSFASTSPTTTIDYDPDNVVRIGKFEDNNENYFFDGLIDELRIYNRVLTTDEINSLYQMGR